MEAELLRSKTELMLLNNQLLEAVQKRLELSLELEAWKVKTVESPRLAVTHTHLDHRHDVLTQTCAPEECTSPLTPQLSAHNTNYDWNLIYASVAFVCRGMQHERGPAQGVFLLQRDSKCPFAFWRGPLKRAHHSVHYNLAMLVISGFGSNLESERTGSKSSLCVYSHRETVLKRPH